MDEKQEQELWLRYSLVWRNILTHVLEWSEERVDQYIGELRRECETGASNPADFGFSYDPPSRYLWSALLGEGLKEKAKGNEANPHLIYQSLVHAIAGSQLEGEMEKPDFDWTQARQRYQAERSRIQEWLTTLE